MNLEEYATMYQVEDDHWWYVGMRRIAASLLEDNLRWPLSSILDAGCGTGANLVALERYGPATGLDIEPVALTFCRQRGLRRLVRGSVMTLPFATESFDLIVSYEVLYHLAVTDDQMALSEFFRVLRQGGWLLLRLPAFDWLRGRHDAVVHTRQRYTTGEVGRKVSAAGFAIVRLSYANCLLFPFAVAKRLAERVWPQVAGSDVGPPPPGNAVLTAILSFEADWLRRRALPFGLSVLCLARKMGGVRKH